MNITRRRIEYVTIVATPDEMQAVFAFLEREKYHDLGVIAKHDGDKPVMVFEAERDVTEYDNAND